MSTTVCVENIGKAYRLGVANRNAFMRTLRSKFYGETEEFFWALRDVSFDVKEGEVLGILGHNGAGKSTLLKILSQITTPTTGSIKLRGRIASLLEVGTGFHPELTGRDNVFLNGAILGMRRWEVAQRLDEIIAFAEVDEFINTPVKRYSTGMRVRLAFAVAAHLEPEILVVDEVLAVGDAAFQSKCLGKIGAVARAGRTVLFVSHNPAAVESLCTRGIVLEHGRLKFAGTQMEAIANYAAGQDQMNISLRDRTDRKGTGEIKIVGAELRDPSGSPLALTTSGSDIELHLFYERHTTRAYPNLSLRLIVQTQLGAPVFTQWNQLSNCTFPADLPEAGAFVCRLPRLPLPPSSYRVGFRLATARRAGEVLDLMEHAFDLPVERGDFFGTGDMPLIAGGVALVPAEWRFDAEGQPRR